MQNRKNTSKKAGKRAARKAHRNPVAGINFEALEVRQMMTVVSVTDFGARANDGASDTNAVQAALNASKAGDTILFNGGTFDFSGEMSLPGDRTYQGTNGATLRGKGANGPLFAVHSNNVTFTGLTFDGGGVKVDKPSGGYNQNIVFDYNVFKLNTSGPDNSCITFTSGLQSSKITNNYFSGYNGAFGVYGYNYNGLTIANNEFVNLNGGVHIDAFGNSGNLLVEQNYLSGIRCMGLEFQHNASNLVFQDNFFEKPNLSSNFADNWNSFAYSLILDGATNVTIRRNTVLAPERPDGVGVRIGFEVGGDNALVEDNYVNGVNHVVAMNDGVGSASVTVRNNRFLNILQGVNNSFPASNRTLTQSNNGPDVQLTWDINRARPGIGAKRYGGSVVNPNPAPTPAPDTTQTPTPAPEPTPDPTPTAPTGPTGLAAIATSATSVNLFWSDRSNNETGYTIEKSTDGQNWNEVIKLGADSAGFTITGLTAGQAVSFRVRALNAVGNSAYSNVATATPTALDPTLGMFVSDLMPTSAINFWGDVERDKSNGELTSGDGATLSLAGKTYTKGLGVHSGSEIHFQLGGQYTNFLSDIGIDDETDGRGSVVFEVWADGQKIYASDTMTAADGRKSINVDIAGKRELVLKVTNGGDTYDFDHADWADARVIAQTSAEPAPSPQLPGSTVYMSDLDWSSYTNGWGAPELDKSNGERGASDGKTITLNGVTYARGVGVHATSDIRYALDGRYSTFTSDIGIDDEVADKGSVIFQVWADGTKLYDSGVMTGASATKSISVDVQGKQELWLIVVNAGDGKLHDHADWADAKLTVSSTATGAGGTYVSTLNPTAVSNGWGPIELNSSVGEILPGDGRTMKVNGRSYTSGIGVHGDSKLVFDLDGQYTTFTTDMGIDDEVKNNGTVVFQIYADGELLYTSGVVDGADTIRRATVNVSGKSQLWLVVNSAGDGMDFDHADWANARLVA